MSRRRSLVALAAAFVAVVFVANTSRLGARPTHPHGWLAHRGVHADFLLDGVEADTCTASRVLPIEHSYIENTLPSMRAAFERGAAAVELDLHASSDGAVVVFHDATLDCRTDGHGAPEEHTLTELRALDLGYGYTADHGATYPLRGTGVGLLSTLEEVLDALPDRTLLLHVKSDAPGLIEHLAAALEARPDALPRRIVYGGVDSMSQLQIRLPSVRTFDKQREVRCVLGYVATGWLGVVPDACADTLVLVPSGVAPWLWGWPRRFESRMGAVGATVVLIERSEHGWIEGFDDLESAATVPEDYGGWVWTDRIEVVAR